MASLRWVWLLAFCIIQCAAEEAVLSKEPARPNIVFILTDDQDTELGGLTPMSKVKKLLKDEGTTFTNMFVTTPICCPSRSSILTGRYQHNHNTLNNSIAGNCSSTRWQQTMEKQTLGVYAKSLKYNTFFGGKYLNQYGKKVAGGPEHVPPGWDKWIGLVGNSKYYNYTVSENGKKVVHGDDYDKDYFTDVLARAAVSYIKDQAQEAHKDPFLMMVATPAPHSPWNAAPKYNASYANGTAPKTGSYNKRGKDQHWLMRQTFIPMNDTSVDYSNNAFRSRWRTLLSVDDLVENIVSTLNSTGLLDNTFIIFSSDNGYHLGQFGLPIDKRQLYEFDLRVPLIVRGPGVPKNATRTEPVLNIDLTPTMIDIANGSAGHFPGTMDGRSFRSLLKASSSDAADDWRNDFLVEYQGEGKEVPSYCPQLGYGVSQCFPNCVCEDAFNNTYSCVRTIVPGDASRDIMYCEFTDTETFVEVYNLTSDPSQLTNIRSSVDPQLLVRMNTRLIELGACVADTCRDNGRHGGDFHKMLKQDKKAAENTAKQWGKKAGKTADNTNRKLKVQKSTEKTDELEVWDRIKRQFKNLGFDVMK